MLAVKEQGARYRIYGPDRTKARASAGGAVQAAIKAGQLVPVKDRVCSQCGRPAKAYHHHKGYAAEYRLDVMPVCHPCHGELHRSERDAMRTHPDWLTLYEAARLVPFEAVTLEGFIHRYPEWGETKHDPCGWTISPEWLANCAKRKPWQRNPGHKKRGPSKGTALIEGR